MAIIRKTNLNTTDIDLIDESVNCIKKGGIIIYPTDTIYGIGCDAFNQTAVQRIYEIKKRDVNKPLLIITHSIKAIEKLVEIMPKNAMKIAEAFWPGPVTMVFNARKNLSSGIVSREGKIAIRIPDNKFCIKLCENSGVPIVSTSANISGMSENVDINYLINKFKEKVDMIIDAGDLSRNIVSTIIDITGEFPLLLREGAISYDQIKSVL